jgi:hypothetical protein
MRAYDHQLLTDENMIHLKTGLHPIVDVSNEDDVMHIQTVDVYDTA